MDVGRYLARIGYQGDPAPDLATLRALHRSHFLSVPFENLSIQRGEEIVLERPQIFEKVVSRRRGGFCLELTNLFAWALEEIGFRVEIVGGRVFTSTGQLSPPLSHMATLVHLDEPWIADVGLGGRIVEPLRLNERAPQLVGAREYVVESDADHWFVTATEPGAPSPALMYTFTLRARDVSEFASTCHWLQTAPDSNFTRGDLATLGTERGRRTYSQGRLILTEGASRREVDVPEARIAETLLEQFGLTV